MKCSRTNEWRVILKYVHYAKILHIEIYKYPQITYSLNIFWQIDQVDIDWLKVLWVDIDYLWKFYL